MTGMDIINVEGATGGVDTNLHNAITIHPSMSKKL